jgi:peptidoglycan/LPS O-acetylase OafA/YrhL
VVQQQLAIAGTGSSVILFKAGQRGNELQKIQDIERLRGIAIVAVLLQHLDLPIAIFNRVGLEPHRRSFWLGVELFFLISGFVVTKSFLAKQMSFFSFYIRRVLRLWPVLLVFFTLMALVNLVNFKDPAQWGDLLHQIPAILFGVYPQWPGIHAGYTGAMWSLSVEEQFYLVAPLTLFLCARLFHNRVKASQWVFFGIVLLIGGVIRFGLHLGPLVGLHCFSRLPYLFTWLEDGKFDLLALGVILYFQNETKRRPVLDRLPVPLLRLLMLAALLTPFVIVYRLSTSLDWNCPAVRSYGMLVTALCFYLVVRLASQNRDLLRFGKRFDSVLLYVGSRSYGLYVLHPPLLVLSILIIIRYAPWLPVRQIQFGLTEAGLFLLMTLPVVELTYRWVERPAIRLGARLTSPRRVAPQPSPEAVPVRAAA